MQLCIEITKRLKVQWPLLLKMTTKSNFTLRYVDLGAQKSTKSATSDVANYAVLKRKKKKAKGTKQHKYRRNYLKMIDLSSVYSILSITLSRCAEIEEIS